MPVTVAISPVNADPTLNVVVPQPDPSTGAVAGSITGIDPDGDTVAPTVTGTSATPKGSVTVNADGSFTYTPADAARHAASADGASQTDTRDTFEITVSDGHGFSTSVSVVVDISPANAAPTAAPSFGEPDSGTGAVSGSLHGADSDGDALDYTLTDSPLHGTVTLSPDGTFAYTPTAAARLQASLTPGADSDTLPSSPSPTATAAPPW